MPTRFSTGTACSQMSRNIEEPLIGTAHRVDVWFLLEYTRPWSARILEDNALPSSVNAWLTGLFETLPNPRLQFIKQDRRQEAPRRLFIVVAHPAQPRMYAFSLETYEEMLLLDVEALLSGSAAMEPYRTNGPLFLVCTNSKRDPCCAKHGFPIYRRMAALAPEQTWQCTHVEGDRFAANVLCFPHGLYYGRVDDAGAEQILKEYPQGRISLEYFRGRSCYAPAVQAAECVLRRRLNEREIDALELLHHELTGDPVSGVEFRSAPNRTTHVIRIVEEQMLYLRYKNCRSTEMTYPKRFREEGVD